MNKKSLFLTITFVIVTFMSISATTFNATKKTYWNNSTYAFGKFNTFITPITNIQLGENEIWWGYFKGNFEKADPSSWHYAGFYSECVYSCCIKINAKSKYGIGKGKTIEGIRFPFADLKNIDHVKIWISTELPSGKFSENANACYMEINKNSLVDAISSNGTNYINEIRFEKPYTITDKDVYVGYTFEVTKVEKYSDTPIVCTNNNNDFISLQDAFYMKFNNGNWENQESYGEVLSMQVLFSGDFMNEALEASTSCKSIAAVKNQEYKVPFTFINTGKNGINSFSYKVTANGVTTDERTVTLDKEINYIGSSFDYELYGKAPSGTNIYELAFEITKVNGMANKGNNTKCVSELISVSKKPYHKVFIEDYTDVNNGACPINFINAEKTKQMFGNDVVFVSIHGECEDPMFCTDYKTYLDNNNVGYAPECVIDRSTFGLTPYDGTYNGNDMHFGFGDDIKEAKDITTTAEIKATAKLSEDKKILNATAYTTFFFNGTKNDYALVYILKEDGMSNDTWTQLNDYYEYKGCGLEDEEPLYNKWINGSAEMKDIIFDNVAIACKGIENGIDGSINGNIKDGETQIHNVTFNLDNYSKIQNADKLSLCVMLLDRATGKIVNTDSYILNDINNTYTNIEIKDNELWWGLFKGNFGSSDPYDWHKVGYGSTLTYGCCMKLHADNIYSMGKGKTIEGIRFAFPDIKNIDNVKVWMSSYLPEKASAEDADLCYMELDRNKLVDGVSSNGKAYVNEIRFDKPYTIEDKDVYVGYTFDMLKIGDAYDQTPIVCYDKSDKILDYKDAFFMRWDDFKWQNQEFDKEALAIQMLMSGDFKDNYIRVKNSFNDLIAKKGTKMEVPATIMNLGRNGISSLSYSITKDGNEIAQNTLTIEKPITYIVVP